MAGRPGQWRKSKIPDEFDAFVRVSSGGCKGWATAVVEDALEWCCFLDSQANGTTWVYVPSCPGVGLAYGSACPTERGCEKRYAAQPRDKDFVSKLRLPSTARERCGMGLRREKKETPARAC